MTSCVSCLNSTKGKLSCDFLFIWKSYENHANIVRKGNTCISCEFHVKIMRLSCDFRNYYNLLYISHISELHLFLFQLSPRSKHYLSVCDFSQILSWSIPRDRTGMPKNCCRTIEEPVWYTYSNACTLQYWHLTLGTTCFTILSMPRSLCQKDLGEEKRGGAKYQPPSHSEVNEYQY